MPAADVLLDSNVLLYALSEAAEEKQNMTKRRG